MKSVITHLFLSTRLRSSEQLDFPASQSLRVHHMSNAPAQKQYHQFPSPITHFRLKRFYACAEADIHVYK